MTIVFKTPEYSQKCSSRELGTRSLKKGVCDLHVIVQTSHCEYWLNLSTEECKIVNDAWYCAGTIIRPRKNSGWHRKGFLYEYNSSYSGDPSAWGTDQNN